MDRSEHPAEHRWSRTLHPSTAEIRVIRRELSRLLRDAGMPDVEPTVALLLDELLANVVLHSRTLAEVVAHWSDGGVRVEVHDGDGRMPVVRSPRPQNPSGRGLHIVNALADRWGADAERDGKVVWFELDRRPA